jgi:hypothetical protein
MGSARCLAVMFLICILSLLLSGCFKRSPYAIAERYVDYLQRYEYVKCYSLLSSTDRAERTLRQFLTEIPLGPDVSPIWFRPILHSIRFELGDEHRNPDGTSAYVPVRITAPDLVLWERTLDAEAGSDGSPGADGSLLTGAYPTVSYADKIFLVKENGNWRVLTGFAGRDRIRAQHHLAMLNFYNDRLDQAIAEFHSMIDQLDQLPGTGNLTLAAQFRVELAAVTNVKAEVPAAVAYSANLKFDKVVMRMSEERVPAIFGEITNGGDRPIDQLHLAVTWYQGRGKDLRALQREEHPIVVTPIQFTDFSRQVIPFLPGEKRHFGFILTAPPEVQQSATPYVSIASLVFSQIPAPLPKLDAASALQARPFQKPEDATPSPPVASAVPSSASAPVAEHFETNSQRKNHH